MSSWIPNRARSVARGAAVVLLWVEPDGGQGVARRNAWAALEEDRHRRAQHLAVDRAVAATLAEREHAAVG
jgi:hypothetical protein